jgi:hypothetical protein
LSLLASLRSRQKNLGTYSKHFIFFETYECGQ